VKDSTQAVIRCEENRSGHPPLALVLMDEVLLDQSLINPNQIYVSGISVSGKSYDKHTLLDFPNSITSQYFLCKIRGNTILCHNTYTIAIAAIKQNHCNNKTIN
jgi:hypothetical protein